MTFTAASEGMVNAFVPKHMAGELHTRKRVQMFIVSQMFGPIIATPIPLFLWFADPHPWPHVAILAASIYGFWSFPALLKLFPRAYMPLAMASVANLSFAVLWGSYNYGGAISPFLVWLVLMPLLALMYLGSTWTARVFVLAQITLCLATLYGVYLYADLPVHIPLKDMVLAGVLSALGVNLCVFVLAAYSSSLAQRQSELIKEIDRQQSTLKTLTIARDDARRANGAKSAFLARMSHELQTPLNAVLGYAEILLDQATLDGRGEQIADLQRIDAAGRHLLAMVSDILDISKIEGGKMALHIEPVDLHKLLDGIEETARPMAAKNANGLVVERGTDLGMIHVDATKLRQTVLNLLSNAAKFTRNGMITLAVNRLGSWIEIAVADTGIGMSREQQQALFSNFPLASSKTASVNGGAGLGLALSQKLCRVMGGGIEFDSQEGKGSRFIIRLPVQAEQIDPLVTEMSLASLQERDGDKLLTDAEDDVPYDQNARNADTGNRAEQDKRERLLVVDDDRNFLELAERLLIRQNYLPICSDAPQSALQIARTVKPTAIFLDTLMPGFDGWDVLAALKADPMTADTPVFMIAIRAERSKALAAGADGIVVKPLDAAKVKAALAAFKSTRRRPRALTA